MAFLGTEKLKELIKTKKVIEPQPDPSRVVCGAYELSLGNEVFSTDSKDRKKQFLTQPKEQVTINPGQFALLLTEEVVNIPNNKIAFISIKAGIKLRGLVNVSGFHVDPGFKGNLVFSVYNAGSSPISLLKGEPCFLIWFSDLELSKDEETSYDKESHDHKGQSTIPGKYIDSLMAGELASPNVLSKRIDDNRTELEKRIGLIEKEQTAKDYLVKTAVGLGIIILMKFGLDWLSYDNGLKKGLELKQKEIRLDSIIDQRIVEGKNLMIEKKKLIIEIDSLEKAKSKLNQPITTSKNENK